MGLVLQNQQRSLRSMSSLDIFACIRDMDIVGLRVDKVYHYPPDEIRIKLRGRGRRDVVIQAGKRFHLTRFPKESPRFPSPFAMLLRKHLEDLRIEEVKQYDFDRVVIIEFQGGKYLIAELFLKGNIVVTDESFKVLASLRDLKIGDEYEFPEKRLTPFDIKDLESLEKILSEREVVKDLAVKLGIGGLYAEEILLRAEVDKKKSGRDLTEEEKKKIFRAIRDIFNFEKSFEPQIILKDNEFIDFQPISLLIYKDFEKKFFENYNNAVDEFYARFEVEMIEKEEVNERLEKLEFRLKTQLEAKRNIENKIERYQRIGDLIYENFQVVNTLYSAFKKARENKSWDEIIKIVEEQKRIGKLKNVVKVNPKNNSLTLKISGYEFEIFLDRSIYENADHYYSLAKKLKEKLKGVEKAIKKTKKEIEDSKKDVRFVVGSRIVRKREWYEKYRWYFTTEGYLVIGGRNAEMNEEIVSKHMESRDLFFHTQTPGGAVTILKLGQEAGERSLKEAGEFSAIYSALWKESKHSGEVYYVKPEQVKRHAKSGEYLPKGSFYIEGRRNYMTVELKAGVGVDLENLRVFGGPLEGVKKYCDYYVELEIGDKEPNKLSIEIAKRLAEMAGEDKYLVRSIATPDEIMKFLPPGKSRIKEAN